MQFAQQIVLLKVFVILSKFQPLNIYFATLCLLRNVTFIDTRTSVQYLNILLLICSGLPKLSFNLYITIGLDWCTSVFHGGSVIGFKCSYKPWV
jgi:hypothetical protein